MSTLRAAVKRDSGRSDVTALSRLPKFCGWEPPASRSHPNTPTPPRRAWTPTCVVIDTNGLRVAWLWPKLAWRVPRPSHGIHP